MAGRYNLQNIEHLLNQGFTAQELQQLCYDVSEFRPVYNRISHATGKPVLVEYLLEYANRTFQIETILIWAKAHNPNQYKQASPYYETGINKLLQSATDQTENQPLQNPPLNWLWLALYVLGVLFIVGLGFGLFLIAFS